MGKYLVDVRPADVLAFIKEQRRPRRGAKVVRIDDGETGLSARTINRRLATIAGLYEYLVLLGGVTVNPVPRVWQCDVLETTGLGCAPDDGSPDAASGGRSRRGRCVYGGAAYSSGPGHGRSDVAGRSTSL